MQSAKKKCEGEKNAFHCFQFRTARGLLFISRMVVSGIWGVVRLSNSSCVNTGWAEGGSNAPGSAAGVDGVPDIFTMAKIAQTTEESINYKKRFYNNTDFEIRNMTDAISHATCGMAIDIDSKAIVACSLSGMTARMVSRFRAPVAIIGLTTNENTWRKLALSWGVIPAMCEKFTSTDVLFYTAKKIATKELGLAKGDRIVITGGDTTGYSGNTNLIKIEEI